MARPQSNGMAIRHVPNQPKPYGVFWRETLTTGERRRRSQYFATEPEATAFKDKCERLAASLPDLPPQPAPLLPTTTTARPAAVHARTAMAASGDLATAGRGTLQHFADVWLNTIVARKKHATQRMYRNVLETHVYQRIGSRPLTTINTEAIVTLIAGCAKDGVSWGTQKAVIRVVSACLRWSVRYRYLAANPCLQLIKDLKDHDYQEPEPNPLSADDAAAFLTWLETGVGRAGVLAVDSPAPRQRGGQPRTAWPKWRPYFLTLLYTGMRRGEAAALKWSTVYLERGQARLERSDSASARLAAGIGHGDVKLKGGRPHDIDLAPAVVDVLTDLARIRNLTKLAGKVSPYVFLTPERGARILSDSQTAERVFDRGMAAIGLADRGHTIHDLRDTFATMHLAKGTGRLTWVSWMLGHKQVSTTLNRYTKYVPQLTGGQAFAGDLDLTPGRPAIGMQGGTK